MKRKLTKEEGRQVDKGIKLPRKCFYRCRAHANPLNDYAFDGPAYPAAADWSTFYPEVYAAHAATHPDQPPPTVRFADIGCGFGGLLVRLSPIYPDKLMLGMEIRDKVAEYVYDRCCALRTQHPGQYTNISCMTTNAMKFLLHCFGHRQLEKLFFLFPDPHFKAANFRRRIINRSLLDEYAYVLQPGGRLYTATDVEALATWMREHLTAHPLFRVLSDEELEADPAAGLLTEATEEGKKVARNSGQTWRCVVERLPDEVLWQEAS